MRVKERRFLRRAAVRGMDVAKGRGRGHRGNAQTIGIDGGISGGKRELRDECCGRSGGQSNHLILMVLAYMVGPLNVLLLLHAGTPGWTGPSRTPPARLGRSARVDAAEEADGSERWEEAVQAHLSRRSQPCVMNSVQECCSRFLLQLATSEKSSLGVFASVDPSGVWLPPPSSGAAEQIQPSVIHQRRKTSCKSKPVMLRASDPSGVSKRGQVKPSHARRCSYGCPEPPAAAPDVLLLSDCWIVALNQRRSSAFLRRCFFAAQPRWMSTTATSSPQSAFSLQRCADVGIRFILPLP